MPKIGGFSFSKVPRPGWPFNPRRRPDRLFRHRYRLTFMARRDVDLVAFHHALQHLSRACRQDPGAQLFGHGLYVTDVEIEFPGDLLVRQVQAHEVEAQNPEPQRLMMAGENGIGEVIEAHLTGRAPVALPAPLPLVMAMSRHLGAPALRAPHALGPAQMPNRLKAPGIVDQALDVDQVLHCGRFPRTDNRGRPRQHRPGASPVILTDQDRDPLASLPPTTPKPV